MEKTERGKRTKVCVSMNEEDANFLRHLAIEKRRPQSELIVESFRRTFGSESIVIPSLAASVPA